jgi:hypothetical protein
MSSKKDYWSRVNRIATESIRAESPSATCLELVEKERWVKDDSLKRLAMKYTRADILPDDDAFNVMVDDVMTTMDDM